MKPATAPRLLVSFEVDLDVEYNSFGGKTPKEIAEALEDGLYDLLYELSPDIKTVFTQLKHYQ